MKLSSLTVLVFALGASLQALASNHSFTTLPRSSPEAQGVSSLGVLEFIDAADPIDAMNSFMLVRHGQVVAEGWWAPYAPESNHELFSLSKSFTSTAVGCAIAEDKLHLDDLVLKFFPENAPGAPSANLKAMRVRDLITMSAGHQDDAPTAPDKISAQAFLEQPVPHKPGTHFKYNTPATFMLSAIVQKVTGQTVRDYLQPRLFEPLGIAHPVWNTNWQGISLGGYGLRVRTEDIAKFGQLYLQKGRWGGRTLLPAAWVEAATSRQVSNGSDPESDWDQGYGFQFWRCRHNAYRGDGAFGQYCLVLPEQDAVIAITSGLKDMQAVLNLIWNKLLPAFHSGRLRSDRLAQHKLQERLGHLTMRTVDGTVTSPAAERIRGRKFAFPSNERKMESVRLVSGRAGGNTEIIMQIAGAEQRFNCGFHEWKKGRARLGAAMDEPMAVSGAWKDDTYVAKQCFYETPFYVTWKLRLDGTRLVLDEETNVGFSATKRPQLVGEAADGP